VFVRRLPLQAIKKYKMEFKYDIAFSFLERDESTALKLYELVRDRLHCFIYSKRKEELITEDGIEKFTEVFSRDSRIVVLLFRENYGKTKWTRIEEAAIKNRGFNSGFEFLVLIPMDENLNVPKWYPDYMIWNNLNTIGFEETSQLLLNKVKTSGGAIGGNPIEAKAERIKRANEYAEKLKHYLMTEEANEDLKEELKKLFEYTEKLKTAIFSEKLKINNEEYKETNVYEVRIPKYVLQFRLLREFNNRILNAKLSVTIFELHVSDEPFARPKPHILTNNEYEFAKDINWNIVWKALNEDYKYTSQELSEKYFYKLLDYYENGTNDNTTNIWC